jgi:NADH-quinone oxidoreductase subunit M
MVYGAFAALAQKDFKRMVAYSSVSHMGYVMLGLGVWSAVAGNEFRWDAWAQGVNGAMFQMLAHGISSAGMFFMVGVLYDRVHHRNLEEFGGIFNRMPVYSGLAVAVFFAGLGLPGLCGFIGEVLVTLSSWNYSRLLAVCSAFTVILTAAYILWAIQRVYLGAEYKGPHGDHLTPMTRRELAIAVPLVVLAIVFGVAPQLIFNYITPTVNRQVETLAEWTRSVHDGHPAAAGATAATDNGAVELQATTDTFTVGGGR